MRASSAALSIATIVISALAILAVAVAARLHGIPRQLPERPGFPQSLMYETDSYSSLTIDELSLVMSLGVGPSWWLWCEPRVLGRDARRRHHGHARRLAARKAGRGFGWAIAGAVASFLTGRIITTVLFVIAAVYLNKMRNTPVAAYGQPVAPYGQPPRYGQPMAYAQPACMASP